MSTITLKCSCGTVRGEALEIGSAWGRRVVCMCRDCQTYARFLGRSDEVLDANGGTDIFQLSPSQLTIREGADQVACMKLSPKGILRWYAECCRTPIANTVSSSQVPFVGIPHSFMDYEADGVDRNAMLGPVSWRICARAGYGEIPDDAHDNAPFGLILRTIGVLVIQRLRGRHKPSPFFDGKTGEPVYDPMVLSLQEREALSQR